MYRHFVLPSQTCNPGQVAVCLPSAGKGKYIIKKEEMIKLRKCDSPLALVRWTPIDLGRHLAAAVDISIDPLVNCSLMG